MSENTFDCIRCGACCASYRVSFYWSEAADLPGSHVEKLTPVLACMAGTNQPAPRCIALSGTVGATVSCTHYSQRPSPCREVEPGDERCREARRRHAIREIG